jgi:hypothetical protein
MKASTLTLTEEVSILIFFSNLTGIGDLSHCPRILLIGSDGKLSPLFRNGIGGIVEEVV